MERVSPKRTRLGWVGLGVMGRSMCAHLIEAGFAMTVYTRSAATAQDVLRRGAVWADSPAAIAADADVVFTMVGYPADVRDVVLGERGSLSGAREGTVLVDMTTSEPRLAVEIASAAAERGVHSIDAPVSGGDVGAREARLSIMIGGEAPVAAALEPCWQVLGRTVVHQGGPGAGQHTKMTNQILIATNMIGVCEGLLYATAAGLDPTTVLESVGSGAAGSWSVANLAPRMIRRDFEPGFFIEHFLKDLGIALDEADRLGLALPGLAMAKKLYEDASRKGLGRKGTQALLLALLLALEHAVKRQGEGRG